MHVELFNGVKDWKEIIDRGHKPPRINAFLSSLSVSWKLMCFLINDLTS